MLFLCTGNYYRSRFAEEYFNYQVKQKDLAWFAESKGLSRDFSTQGHVGPISVYALSALEQLGIDPKGHERMPEYAQENHFQEFDHIIALSLSEHKPMMEEIWGDLKPWNLRFFYVEDTHKELPGAALLRLQKHLDHLIRGL